MTEGSDHHTKRPRRTSRKPEPPALGTNQPTSGSPPIIRPRRADQQGDRGGTPAKTGVAPEDWAAIGTVAGAFGLHGDLKVQPLTDFPERFEQTSIVYVGKAHTPRKVTSARIQGRLVVMHLEGVETATEAQRMRGQPLSIPAAELLPLPQDSYYLHDLIGLRVVHVDGTPLGVVADVITGAGNDLFVVRRPQGGEVLVPAVKEFIKSVDVPDGVVRIEPIPGLFDEQAIVADEHDQDTPEPDAAAE